MIISMQARMKKRRICHFWDRTKTWIMSLFQVYPSIHTSMTKMQWLSLLMSLHKRVKSTRRLWLKAHQSELDSGEHQCYQDSNSVAKLSWIKSRIQNKRLTKILKVFLVQMDHKRVKTLSTQLMLHLIVNESIPLKNQKQTSSCHWLWAKRIVKM